MTALLSDEAKEQQSYARAMAQYEHNWRSLMSQARRALQGEISDEDAMRRAQGYVNANYPDLDESTKETTWKKKYVELRDAAARQRIARTKALGRAIEGGAAIRPGQVVYSREQQEAIRQGIPYKLTHTQAIGKMLKDADDEGKLRILTGRLTEEEKKRLQEYRTKDQFGAPSKMGGILGKIDYGLGFVGRGIQGTLEGALEKAGEIAGPARAGEPTFAGVPKEAFAEKFGGEGAGLGDILTEALSQGWEAATEGGNTNSLARRLESVKGRYKLKAKDIVKQQVGRNLNAGDLDAVRKVYKTLMQRDSASALINNPNLTQFAVELGLDPMTWAGGAITKLAGKTAGKAALAVPGVARGLEAAKASKAVQSAGKLAEGFQFMPSMKRLEKTGEAGAEAASMTRMADAQSHAMARDFSKRMEGHISEMRKVGKDRRAELMRYLEDPELERMAQGSSLEDIAQRMVPADLRDAWLAGKNAADEAYDFSSETGILRDWKSDVLGQAGRREAYVPHYAWLDEKGARSFPDQVGRAAMKSRSGRKRTGAEDYIRDPVEQWESWLAENIGKGRGGQQMKLTRQVMEKHKFVHTAETADEARDLATSLTKSTDGQVNYVVLSGAGKGGGEGLGTLFNRVTGIEGAKKADQIVVPDVYEQLLNTMAPILTPKDADIGQRMMKGLNQLNSLYMRPWRMMNTIPGTGFAVRNAWGGFGLSTIGLGLQAFDPKLQAKAVAAGFAAALGDDYVKLAGKIKWKVGNGTMPLDEVIRAAKSVGITNQLEQQLVTQLGGRGIGQKFNKLLEKGLEFGGVRGLRVASPAMMATATENYQHMTQFMGFLSRHGELAGGKLTNRSLAKVLDLTSKYAGNYSRLGELEKGFLRNTIGFYAWSRFILPHMLTQLYENPGRLGAWVKATGGLERYYGANAPFSPEGMPDYMQAWGITAPEQWQPKTYRPGTHQFAVMMLETPQAMGFSLLPVLSSVFGGQIGNQRAADNLGPLMQMAIELVTRRDIRTGSPLPPVFDVDSFPEFAASSAGRIATGLFDRPRREWQSLADLYRQQGMPIQEVDLRLRYQVGRTFLGLDNLAMKMAGKQGLSVGGLFDPNQPWDPAMLIPRFTYLVDPQRTAARVGREAIRGTAYEAYKMENLPAQYFGQQLPFGEE
jgi:hypothetical protein